MAHKALVTVIIAIAIVTIVTIVAVVAVVQMPGLNIRLHCADGIICIVHIVLYGLHDEDCIMWIAS